MLNSFSPNFAATGIGSLPHHDANSAVELIIKYLSIIPYWPQLPMRSTIEHMQFQYIQALTPLIKADLTNKTLIPYSGLTREEALTLFYERLLKTQINTFALTPKESNGLFTFLSKLKQSPDYNFKWVKGHICGPLTIAASVKNTKNKALLYDDEITEAISQGIGIAAAAQVKQLSILNRPVIIFLDEPILSGYGSAFSPITREKAIKFLKICLEECRKQALAIIGIHCCGNTDWSLLIEADFDIISLDSVNFGANLLLYYKELKKFYQRGGIVAWGVTPTTSNKNITAYSLWNDLKKLLNNLFNKGIEKKTLASQSLLTPTCGLASLTENQAENCLKITCQISDIAKKEF